MFVRLPRNGLRISFQCACVLIFAGCSFSAPEEKPHSEDWSHLIRVESPRAGSTVEGAVAITGEARGVWFFEATFPVELQDAEGNVVVQSYATAQGNWMTEDFVPFSASVDTDAVATATGTLVLRRSNPSGLPEHDADVRIPLRFPSFRSIAR